VLDGQALLERIQALPADRIVEIEDSIDFIAVREQQRSVTRGDNCKPACLCRHLGQPG
jgi:hypothetical protein